MIFRGGSTQRQDMFQHGPHLEHRFQTTQDHSQVGHNKTMEHPGTPQHTNILTYTNHHIFTDDY